MYRNLIQNIVIGCTLVMVMPALGQERAGVARVFVFKNNLPVNVMIKSTYACAGNESFTLTAGQTKIVTRTIKEYCPVEQVTAHILDASGKASNEPLAEWRGSAGAPVTITISQDSAGTYVITPAKRW